MTGIAKGERPDIVELIGAVMDGNAPDMASLSQEMVDYVKTVKVILGEPLFSNAYLEI